MKAVGDRTITWAKRPELADARRFARYGAVGLLGYGANLTVFALLLGAGLHYAAAACGAFVVAVSQNFALHRVWTFAQRGAGQVLAQGVRYLTVSLVALACNVVALSVLISSGVDRLGAQAIAVVLLTPVSFAVNKIWSFGPSWSLQRPLARQAGVRRASAP
jgi:dolichol-phosphate mannosyltransferase